jgi:hypothetical protein
MLPQKAAFIPSMAAILATFAAPPPEHFTALEKLTEGAFIRACAFSYSIC